MRIPIAITAATGTALLASRLGLEEPTSFDRRVRRVVQRPELDVWRKGLRPLFPLGLPGGYITIGYATAHWLRRRRGRGGPAIVTAAWLGWIGHRLVKLAYRRRRPLRPDKRHRTDSYPSGHTTGTTALASSAALALRRAGLVSTRQAVALGVIPPAIMGAYRVIADDHWATDVFGGWMLGAAIGLACDAALGEAASPAARRVRELESTSRSSHPRVRRGSRSSTA